MNVEITKKSINIRYIKQLREKNHLSQTQVSKLIGLTSPDKYNRRENGDFNFQATELQALSQLFNVKMENFFF
ncbi:helix-turn-helix transcriptional regulator [Lactiplantibacillus mudanjiangensis]|uniref:Phage Cro-like repressor [Lactobacillus hokkaidonensis JCM] n=1 Tax=Lactiplantibacillus mudanjiangensis TaxID=1296538 RepID=A0A660E4N9_9LACO|nr:helix-turn-helix transcriptional regulator [Lactiplantibacillus mudanjiangensis]VDG25733.1 phage Cro-like repressor [Lactobacillus hokkaidonensis JCM] [Lactiplantibacillus mudanjiangensis]VDG27908.1 phage Cro-like repressor [Lactobacillus hokkaidonensis JCM] [Lactiplantibacillus mudanjiangensis]